MGERSGSRDAARCSRGRSLLGNGDATFDSFSLFYILGDV